MAQQLHKGERMTDRAANPEITRNQLHSARRLVKRLLDENRGLQAVAVARRELQADHTSLWADMAEIKAAAEAGSLREVVRIVDDATARRERTREQRKVKADG